MSQHETFQIGIARGEITPPVGATMVGYNARTSTEVGHSLRAEVMVCRDPSRGWVLVASDTIGYTRDYARKIREAIAEATGIPADAVILSGTHTHSGPCTILFGRGENLAPLDQEYLASLPAKLAEIAGEASRNASPGFFASTWTEAPEFAHNRRAQREDGTWINVWQDPEGQCKGFYDPAILLVAVCRPDGRREALLVNYGCHPVVLGPNSLDLTADYVGYLKDQLEADGAAETVLFTLAACGNINPRNCILTGTEAPKAAGETLAAIIMDALDQLQPLAGGVVGHARTDWEFPRTREVLKRKDRGESQRIGDPIQTEVSAVRAGALGLLAVPGELFSEFNETVRESSPTPVTLVVTMANDYIGYIPTDQAQEEGAYETTMAPAEGMEKPFLEAVGRAYTGLVTP